MFNDEWLTERAMENQDNATRGTPPISSTHSPTSRCPRPSCSTRTDAGRIIRFSRGARDAPGSPPHRGRSHDGLKVIFGRVRPRDEPDDPFTFDPFSGHGSFPSGHTTITFAAAVALDRETTSGWVPWIVYPAATMVGWSRVQDLDHWASDVVAGAAIGGWVSWKMESLLAGRALGCRTRRRCRCCCCRAKAACSWCLAAFLAAQGSGPVLIGRVGTLHQSLHEPS